MKSYSLRSYLCIYKYIYIFEKLSCLEQKEMATHSSVLAWKIPWTGAWWATVCGAAVRHDSGTKPQQQPWLERIKDASPALSASEAHVQTAPLPFSLSSHGLKPHPSEAVLGKTEIEREVFRFSSRNAWGLTSFSAMVADPSDFISFIFLFDSYPVVVEFMHPGFGS